MCAESQSKLRCLGEVDRLQRLHNKLNEFDQCVQGWNDALALEGHSLAERYERDSLTIICNFEMFMPFEWPGGDVRINDQPSRDVKRFASLVYRNHSLNKRVLPMCDQEPMFVFDVEVMQIEKNLALASTVGLYEIPQESLDLFSGVLFESIDGTFKALSGFAGGKLGVFGTCNARSEPSKIEGGAKIMECISQNPEEDRGKWLSRSNAEHIVSSARVGIDCDTVRVLIAEEFRPHLKLLDVLFGPVYF